MTQLFFQSFCTKTKRWLQNGQNDFYTAKTLLSKNGLRIAVGRLVKLLEKNILRQAKKSEYFSKMVLELLQDA